MSLNYDLHSHSTASDGTLTPTELITRAHVQGVDVLALTDHDVTDGLAEAGSVAARLGLRLVPGVEISVSWNSAILHILGLHIDPENNALQAGLAGLRAFRDRRAEEIGKGLEEGGIIGAYEGAKTYARCAIISRTHFARFLVEHGHARDMQQVFKRFMVPGKPGYVPGRWATLQEAMSWIHESGGQAVIAHPARYKLNSSRLQLLLKEFKALGGEAIEVISGSHNTDDCSTMARYAERYSLRASKGSDYHGPDKPWIELGELPELPAGCLPIWEDWSLKRQ